MSKLLPIVEVIPLKEDVGSAVRYAIRRQIPSALFKNVKAIGLDSVAVAATTVKPNKVQTARQKDPKRARAQDSPSKEQGDVNVNVNVKDAPAQSLTQQDADARLRELGESTTRLEAERAQLVARIELANHLIDCYKRRIEPPI